MSQRIVQRKPGDLICRALEAPMPEQPQIDWPALILKADESSDPERALATLANMATCRDPAPVIPVERRGTRCEEREEAQGTAHERVIPATDLRKIRDRIAYARSLAGVCGNHHSCHSHPCIHAALDALKITLDEYTAKEDPSAR